MGAKLIDKLGMASAYGEASDNLLVLGENLDTLNRIKAECFEKIQCIYLDPPYNSCNPFDMFNDCVPQEEWETALRKRLSLLWTFLKDTGSIWISIDDYEFADLKVICDSLWGRDHFVLCIVRQKNKYPSSIDRSIVHMHDYILVYAKDPQMIKLHNIALDNMGGIYRNPDKEFFIENLLTWKSMLDSNVDAEDYMYAIDLPDGSSVRPPKERCWRVTYEQFLKLKRKNQIWFDEKTVFPYVRRKLNKNDMIRTTSLWCEDEVGSNQEARYEIRKYDMGKFFYVPKPERLLYRILSICTDVGDWVLDPYLGSGTTAAVAQKMSRKWIGIEQEKDQMMKICMPRLMDVVNGEGGGVSPETNWHGGGGFQFVELPNT